MPGPANPYELYDPLLATTDARGAYPHWLHGFKLWPAEPAPDATRIMILGNSTAMLPQYPWSIRAGERLTESGRRVQLFVGAGSGHTSAQELLRVIRDAPPVRPAIILAMSGICDLGFINASPLHGLYHRYMRPLTKALLDAGAVQNFNPGFPEQIDPASRWLRYQRLAHLVAEELGAVYIAVLPPVMGAGGYAPSAAEAAIFAAKAGVVLKSAKIRYDDAVSAFYSGVKAGIARAPARHAHVRDFTNLFADASEVYLDHRHWNAKGCAIVGDAVFSVLDEALG